MKHRCLWTVLVLSAFALTAALGAARAADDPDEQKEPLVELLRLPTIPAEELVRKLDETIFNLGQIKVSSGRLDSEIGGEAATDLPYNVTLVRRRQVEEDAATDLPTILSRSEGVSYSDDLGAGLGARVDLRGFGGEGKQALVLFDGLRAVEPIDNSVSWHLYPSQLIERAEVRRGGGSTVYGEGALSGVILLKTKEPTESPRAATEHSYGDHGTRMHFAEASGTAGPLGAYVGARYLTTDGYRQNGDHEGTSSLLKGRYTFSDALKVENSFYFADHETGIAGPLTAAELAVSRRQKDPDAQFGDQFLDKLIQDELRIDLLLEPLGIGLSDVTGYRRREQDSLQTFSSGTSRSRIKTETFSKVLQADWTFERGSYSGGAALGAEFSKDDIYNPSDFLGSGFTFPSENAVDRRMLGTFFQSRIRMWERLTAETGVRWDRIDWDIYDLRAPNAQKRKEADSLSPKFGIQYELAEPVSVYASYAESFKAPDAATLIFETPGLLSPNPDIDPQLARHREVGARYAHPDLGSLRADYFYIETKKEILFNAVSFKNENFDTIRHGAEIAAEARPWRKLQLFANWTYTRAEFDHGAFDGKEVPLVPGVRASAGFVWEMGGGFRLSSQATGSRDQFALNDFANRIPVEDYWTLGGKLSYHRDSMEIYLRGQNLLGEEYSSFVTSNSSGTVNFNPAPSSFVEAGFRVEI